MSMQQYISSVCRTYLELRRIASIRPYLTQSATAQLVSSAITSRLDYCNSILAGLPLKQISRLQSVQNNAAKLVLRKSNFDHVTPLLQELHWLPIKFRPQHSAPSVWNSLPSDLRNCSTLPLFKSRPKTYLS